MGRNWSGGLTLIGVGVVLTLVATDGRDWASSEGGQRTMDDVGVVVRELADTVSLEAEVKAGWETQGVDVSATVKTDDASVGLRTNGGLPEAVPWTMPDRITTSVTFGRKGDRRQ